MNEDDGPQDGAVDQGALVDPASGRVLIVDDEEGIRGLFSMIIAHDLPDVHLDEARNGEEALSQFQREHHRVLIMDLHMPVMDGLTAFAKIQQFCESSRIRMPAVIFCSGFAPPRRVRDIVSASTRHFILSKPVKSDVLVRAIRTRL